MKTKISVQFDFNGYANFLKTRWIHAGMISGGFTRGPRE